MVCPVAPTNLRVHSDRLDPADPQRLGALLLLCTDLSTQGYVLIRHSSAAGEWRVNVRRGALEHVTTSAASVTEATDRAFQWLRAAHINPDA